MKLWSDNLTPNQAMPARFAFCKPDPASHATFSDNVSPHLAWSDLPAETKSLVLILHDSDAPVEDENANKEGVVVPAAMERADFFHWVVINLPPSLTSLAEGESSRGVTPRGKPDAPLHGGRQGLNDYTNWFFGDAEMDGTYFGYDGPCPPWNDERVHHYHFTLYALDVPELSFGEEINGDEVQDAIEGHVLDQASFSVTYALNPAAKLF